MRSASRIALGGWLLLLLAACRTGPDLRTGETDQVEIRNTLGELVSELRRVNGELPEGPRAAWLRYENRNLRVLRDAHALAEDPGDQLLAKIAASPEATLALLGPVDRYAQAEARQILQDLEAKLGRMPPSVLVFGAAREWQPVFRGRAGARPLTFLNARHVAFATPGGRKAGIARALFQMMQEARVGPTGSVGPLAMRVYREGSAALAVRMLVPDAPEGELLHLEPEQLTALRGRDALIARELLSAIDSGNEAEVARFFSADLKDPLLPRGAGTFISDRLFQKLALQMGSLERTLKLGPAEFLQRARAVLRDLSRGS